MAAMARAIDRLRRRSGSDAAARAGRRLLRLPGAWRLPLRLRRRLAEGRTGEVHGQVPAAAAPRTVLVVSHELSATGAPKLMAEMVLACREAGWSVVVVAPEPGPHAALAGPDCTVVVHPDALGPLSPAVTLAAHADAVICNTVSCVRLVGYLPAARTVWSLHETALIDVFRQAAPETAPNLRRVAEVWASSPLVARHVTERADCHVIGAAVPAIPAGPARPGAEARAVILGSVEARKGQDLAVAARALLPAPLRDRLRIDVFGNVREADYAAAFFQAVAGDASLRFGGEIAPKQAAAEVAAADLVIVPSRDEPLSLVAIEAMSAGRPVVCSRAAGIAEYLEDGVSAFIADAPTPEALAEALERCLRARAEWPAVAARARVIYERRFTPERFRAECRERLEAVFARA